MDYNELVARNVRRFRRERGLSLGELSRRSGLSKQTLSKVEQGVGNPTVDTLSALGDALDVSPRRLLTVWGSAVYVQREATETWQRQDDGSAERVLDQVYGSGYVHTSLLTLEGEGRVRSFPGHSLGTLIHLYVIAGALRTGPLEEQVDLATGDFVRFPGDIPYRHTCLAGRMLAHVVMTIPQAGQFGPPAG
ncbi:XRE family transcriptional regulator [Nonomuraea muscovyensis]|uniref:XRE family transcriptional regulator n=1 Tax=Nonomuraea muscovyensis TaxID=1124761 RepID=UPI0033E19300